jgi:Tol biopolymer transport system component
MKTKRLFFFLFIAIALIAVVGMSTKPQFTLQTNGSGLLIGRNVNMVSGTEFIGGDPFLQRQNEPSIAVSTRNPLHLLAGANDYRTIDIPFQDELPGIPEGTAARDAWLGVFKSIDGGESWTSTLLPGYPQDISPEGTISPIHGYDAACDPKVRAGDNGLFYYSGIAINRADRGAGVVFVARYVDNNNIEGTETIEYIDTNIVDLGNAGQFLDMPSIAVGLPQGLTSTQTIRTASGFLQDISNANVYIAYSVFLGNTVENVRSRILFASSTDCALTWSKPIKLSESQHILQRPMVVIDPSDPTGNTLYVSFRSFAHGNNPDAIFIVKSTDGGQTFTKPIEVASFYPFDQGTSIYSFRTNSYPTLAVDGEGIVYLAWTQRKEGPDGFARIAIKASTDGIDWSGPAMYVDDSVDARGHQFMPSITYAELYASGKLMIAWYDQRDDLAVEYEPEYAFTEYIEDSKVRHTIDVRVALIEPGLIPMPDPSERVSRYLHIIDENENIKQVEFNPPNYTMFQLGTVPFHGDWLEIVPSMPFLPSATAQSTLKISSETSRTPAFHVVWTDNRDVRPPYGDWWVFPWPSSVYNAPESGTNRYPCTDDELAGVRNQNIYTASITTGITAGSSGNTKPLDDIQHTFIIFVKNTTSGLKSFRLTVDASNASFRQNLENRLPTLDVEIPPYSTVTRTVFADPPHSATPIRVDVVEIDAPAGSVKPGGLTDFILLNPDPTNPPVYDPYNPEVPLYYEYHNPRVENPRVENYDLGAEGEMNPRVLNSEAENPRVLNPRVLNPRVENLGLINPRVENSFLNPEMENPRVENPRVLNTAMADVVWEVGNEGNTTSSYTLTMLSEAVVYDENGENPHIPDEDIITQVLVYKIHTTPVGLGCDLLEDHSDELLLNVTNPRVENPRVWNPRVENAGEENPRVENPRVENATFALAPGEEAYVIWRIWDDDAPANTSGLVRTATNGNLSIEDVIGPTDPNGVPEGAGAALSGHAANTEDVEQGDYDPPVAMSENIAPLIGYSPSSLDFTAPVGGPDDSLDLFINNTGEGFLDYTLTIEYQSGSDWLSLDSSEGQHIAGDPANQHVVTAHPAGLSEGTYEADIVIEAPGALNSPQTVPVTLTIVPIVSPSKVELTGPGSVGGGFISEVFTLSSQDIGGNPTNVTQDTVFDLISDSSGICSFYSDPEGTSRIIQVTIPEGQNSVTFYYMDPIPGTRTVTATWVSGDPGLGTAHHQPTVWAVVGQIAFTSDRDGNQEIYIMNADGTGVNRLTDNTSSDEMPCWSPGGGKFAFTSDRDGNTEIYVMNADGSWQQRLTDSAEYDGEPCWSPDGSKIVFSSFRDNNMEIYIMNADGSVQTNKTNDPARDVNPNWSPDGSKIAFSSNRDGDAEIYVVNIDGSGLTQLTDNSIADGNPCWSPDGSKIAFISGTSGAYEIYIMNADGSGALRLTNNAANDYNPTWSPDSSRIAFLSNRDGDWEIFVMNADGTEQTNLTDNLASDENVNWGGAKIAYTRWESNNYEVYVINPDGSGQTNITNSPEGSETADSWSPDGNKIAFYSKQEGNYEIYVMNADGSGVTNLTNDPTSDMYPNWSPDGNKIAFTSGRDGSSAQIYVMNIDGSEVTQLTYIPGNDYSPAWSPCGSKIVWDCNSEIYVMNSDGSEQTNLTNNAARDENPRFSPNGNKIVFYSDRDGNDEIYIMDADGTNVTRLTDDPAVDCCPCFSPDGNKIAFYSQRNGTADIYIMEADGTNIVRVTTYQLQEYIPLWRPRPRILASLMASQVELSGPASVEAGAVSDAFTLTSQNSLGIPTNVIGDTVFDLTSTSEGTVTYYLDSGGTEEITQVTIASGTSSATFYYEDTELGDQTVTGTFSTGPYDLGTSNHIISVTAGAAGQVELTGPASVAAGAVSGAFTLESQDGGGNPTNVTADTVFALSSNTSGTATFYSDSDGNNVITQVTITNGTSSATFYYNDSAVGTPTVTAAWTSGSTDLGSATHLIQVTAPPTFAEINIKQNTTDITDGGGFDFGSQSVGTDTDVVFTIENLGDADLVLSISYPITGTDADQFSVQAYPPSNVVAPASSTTFTIRFSPTSEGAKSADIAIANSDSDENPYDITLTGTAVPLSGIAYIYTSDTTTANSFKDFLEGRGYPTTLISWYNIEAGIFANCDIILIGYETNWGVPEKVSAVNDSGKPILGLARGGEAFFDQLNLEIGESHGGYDDREIEREMYVVDPSHLVYTTPNNITIPGDQIITIYSSSTLDEIHLGSIDLEKVLVMSQNFDLNGNVKNYSSLIQENRYLLWGWFAAPDTMTDTGKDLFENVVNMLSSAPLHTVSPPALVIAGGTNRQPNFSVFWGPSVCSLGHPVEHQIDFGDGNQSPWFSGYYYSSYSYSAPGVYQVKARGRCTVDTGVVSEWSSEITHTVNPIITGSVLEGVEIVFSGGAGSVTSGVGGLFEKTVSYGWSGTAVPNSTAAGYNFSPAFRTYTDLNTDASGQGYSVSTRNVYFVTQPTSTYAGSTISPAPKVILVDDYDEILPGYTITIGLGANPGGGTLTGAGTYITGPDGTVTLYGLSINTTGSGYTIVATAGSKSVSSLPFDIY